MTHRSSPLKLGLLALALWCGSGWIAFASTPAEHIQGTMNRVLDILQNHKDKTEAEKKAMLRQAVYPLFDFTEMARKSLGNHWEILAERQKEFVAVFAGFMESSYLVKLQSYKDEKVLYTREQIGKSLAEVDTKVVPRQGDEVSINYRLHFVEDQWKVYDVFIDNTSLVTNLRAQFSRIITSASLDKLLEDLREKTAKNQL